MSEKIMPKTLPEHAAYELTKSGFVNDEDPENRKIATDVMALVRRFDKQKHNERTGRIVLDFFETICFFLPLTPITDDPDEWEKFDIESTNRDSGVKTVAHRWQSRRAPSIISEDEGHTFTDLRTNKTGESVNHIEYAKKVEAEKAARDQKRAEMKSVATAKEQAPNVLAQPPTDTSAPAGEEAPALQETTPEAPEPKEPIEKKADK